jgi:mono/diheme cytochrome c family protein
LKELLPFTLAYGAHRFMRYGKLQFAMLVVCLSGLELGLAAQQSGHDASWKAPASASAKKNPLVKDANAARAGQSTFLRSCSTCHGETGDAGIAGASNLKSAAVQAQTDGALEWKIANGNVSKGMPAFGSMSQEKLWQLVRFIRTLKSSTKAAAAH